MPPQAGAPARTHAFALPAVFLLVSLAFAPLAASLPEDPVAVGL